MRVVNASPLIHLSRLSLLELPREPSHGSEVTGTLRLLIDAKQSGVIPSGGETVTSFGHPTATMGIRTGECAVLMSHDI
jgi:uncharacterized Zn-binding protein involved in type VI secretion